MDLVDMILTAFDDEFLTLVSLSLDSRQFYSIL